MIHHIFLAPRSCAAPGLVSRGPLPSQTNLHVTQRVQPARYNFERASSNHCNIGSLYRDNDVEVYVKLKLQIRQKK